MTRVVSVRGPKSGRQSRCEYSSTGGVARAACGARTGFTLQQARAHSARPFQFRRRKTSLHSSTNFQKPERLNHPWFMDSVELTGHCDDDSDDYSSPPKNTCMVTFDSAYTEPVTAAHIQ